MSAYDFERPYINQKDMGVYLAIDADEAKNYGTKVKATQLSNLEYKTRFDRLKVENNMKPPPSTGRIFSGYLVVRKLGTGAQYETWMPEEVFEEIYRMDAQKKSASVGPA